MEKHQRAELETWIRILVLAKKIILKVSIEEDTYNILRRKANYIGHILRKNCLLHDTIEEQMTEVKGVGRRKLILDDLRNRRRYWKLKEEAEDQKRWIRQFISRT